MPGAEREIRLRLWWTALLVLIALSGAGLAVAADRPHGPARPELFFEAEAQYGPWVDSAWSAVRNAGESLADVSSAGREALGTLQALDPTAAEEHLNAGDRAVQALIDLDDELVTVGGVTFAQIERWRMSDERQAQIVAIEAAVAAARTVPSEWPPITTTGRTMSQALQALLRHDGLVFRATTAGRQSEWQAALDLLGQASSELAAAGAARDALAAQGSVETLTALLERYAAYDAALANLYTYVRDTGVQTGADFDGLRSAVDVAQAALPGSDDVLAVVVGESAAPALTAALVRIEQARGEVIEALALAPESAP
jgi:hypothetical protein